MLQDWFHSKEVPTCLTTLLVPSVLLWCLLIHSQSSACKRAQILPILKNKLPVLEMYIFIPRTSGSKTFGWECRICLFIRLLSIHWNLTLTYKIKRASLVAQTVKSLPVVHETRVWSLGQHDPLEKKMATHSSILAWKIPWVEEFGRLQSMGSQRVRHNWVTSLSLSLYKIKAAGLSN